MKVFLLIISLITMSVNITFGQKQDTYKIKYIGSITSKSLKIKAVRLPTTLYLHGEEDKKSMAFYTATPQNNTVELLCYSHLVNSEFLYFDVLKKLYLNKTTAFPIELSIVDGQNWERSKMVYLSWDKIKFIKPKLS